MNIEQVLAGRYRIERHAGQGGMASVFRAVDLSSGHPVAIKVLHGATDDLSLRRFEREAALLSRLRHPGIVRFLDQGTLPDGTAFLALEWVEGETLQARLQRRGLSWREAMVVVERTGDALGYAHELGIVHRDVKPTNIILENDDLERCRLIDFGVAHDRSGMSMTRTGMIIGTASYLSPEQARGLRDIDARADVYSLGTVFFRCLTGRLPFEATDLGEMLAKIVMQEAPRVHDFAPGVPNVLDDLVARMLAKDASVRPSRGSDVSEALRAFSRSTSSSDPRMVAADRPEAVTAMERRPVCVAVVYGRQEVTSVDVATDATGVATQGSEDDGTVVEARAKGRTVCLDGAPLHRGGASADRLLLAIRQAAVTRGGRLDQLADGALLATFAEGGSPADMAHMALSYAEAISAVVPDVPVVLATGHGVNRGLPVGEAIERAFRILEEERQREGTATVIRLDSTTFHLVEGHRSFQQQGDRIVLCPEVKREGGSRLVRGIRTPTVGRERELLSLLSSMDECMSESQSSVSIVVGEPGVGKSRLCADFRRQTEEREDAPTLFYLRCDPMLKGTPLGLVTRLLERAIGVLPGDDAFQRRSRLDSSIAEFVPDDKRARVAASFAELLQVGTQAEREGLLAANRREPTLLNEQIREALDVYLGMHTARNPLVLVVDDGHWADVASLSYLDTLLRNLDDRPLYLVVFARPSLIESSPQLFRGRRLSELRLRELSRKGCERLIRTVLGQQVSADVVARLSKVSHGNPFFLEEILRAHREDGDVPDLPPTVVAMVEARLSSLDAGHRRVLRAASVFGSAFLEAGVSYLLGASGASLARESLMALEEAEVITRVEDGAMLGAPGRLELYDFRHATVREAAYAMLTDEDKERAHALAGEFLSKGEAFLPEAIARHFELGKTLDRAAHAYRLAADRALEANDFAAAESLAQAAIRCGASGDELGYVELDLAEAHRWRNEFSDAYVRAKNAKVKFAVGSLPYYRALTELAVSAARSGHEGELDELSAELLGMEPEEELPAYLMAAAETAIGLSIRGRKERAACMLRLLAKYAPISDQDPLLYAASLRARSMFAIMEGNPGPSYTELRALLARLREAALPRALAMATLHMAYENSELGDYALALPAFEEALVVARRFGSQTLELNAMHNLGLVLLRLGRHAEALDYETRARDAYAERKDVRFDAGSSIYLSFIRIAMGHLDKAIEEAKRAVQTARDSPADRVQAEAALAYAELCAGHPGAALAIAKGAAELRDSLGGMEELDALLRLVLVRAHLAHGHEAEADAILRQACKRLSERAAMIPELDKRRTFLSKIPEHDETMALALDRFGPTSVLHASAIPPVV